MTHCLGRFIEFSARLMAAISPRRSPRHRDRFERRRLGRICDLESLEARQLLTWVGTFQNGILNITDQGITGATGDLKVDSQTGNILLNGNVGSPQSTFLATGANLTTLVGPIQIDANFLPKSNFIIDNNSGEFFNIGPFPPAPLGPGGPSQTSPSIVYSGDASPLNTLADSSLTILGSSKLADTFIVTPNVLPIPPAGSTGQPNPYALSGVVQDQETVPGQPGTPPTQENLWVGYSGVTGNLTLDGEGSPSSTNPDTLLLSDALGAGTYVIGPTTIQGPDALPPPSSTQPPAGTVGQYAYQNFGQFTLNLTKNTDTVTFNNDGTPTTINSATAGSTITVNENQPLAFPLNISQEVAVDTLQVNGAIGGGNNFYVNTTTVERVDPSVEIQPGASVTPLGAAITFGLTTPPVASTGSPNGGVPNLMALNVAGMGGNNVFTLQWPKTVLPLLLDTVGGLPTKVTFFGGVGPGYTGPALPPGYSRLRVFGNGPGLDTTGADVITVGDPSVNGQVTMNGLQGLVVYGLGGNDDITNASKGSQLLGIPPVPAILIGGPVDTSNPLNGVTLNGGAAGDILIGGNAGVNTLTSTDLKFTTSYLFPHQDINGDIFDVGGSSITAGKGSDTVVSGVIPPTSLTSPGDIDRLTGFNTTAVGNVGTVVPTADPNNPTSFLYEVTPALLALETAFQTKLALAEFGNRNLRGEFATYAGFVGRAYAQLLIGHDGRTEVSRDEINFWVQQGQQGLSIQQMIANILASDEYRQSTLLPTIWARSLFEVFLNDFNPTTADMNTYAAPLLTQGDTAALRFQLAMQFLNTLPAQEALIGQMYEEFFPGNVTPSTTDQQAIVSDLNAGIPLSQIAQILFQSGGSYLSYEVAHNVGEIGFVGNLYQDVLQRPGSVGELSFWANQVGSGVMNNFQVAEAILNSPEHRGQVIDSYYLKYLGRPADPGGMAFWQQSMANGATQEQVQAAIIGSDEFYADSGSTSPTYITAVYQHVLGRTPAQSEIDFWITVLAAAGFGGSSARADVALGFITSTEHRTALVDQFYQTFQGSPPTAAQFDAALQQFFQGADEVAVEAGILVTRPTAG